MPEQQLLIKHLTVDALTERIVQVLNTPDDWLRKAQAMGFQFEPWTAELSTADTEQQELSRFHFYYHAQCRIRCVCGRRERFSRMLFIYRESAVNHLPLMVGSGYRLMFESGAFDYQHLIDDGFTHKEAMMIVKKGEAFGTTQVCREPWPGGQHPQRERSDQRSYDGEVPSPAFRRW